MEVKRNARMGWKPLAMDRWQNSPRLVRRFYAGWALCQLGLLGALAVMWLLELPRHLAFGWCFALLGAWAACLPVLVFIAANWEKRLMSRLEEAEYRLCPQCGHRLTGLTGSTACPECGAPCEVKQVQSTWRAFRPIMIGPFH